MAQLVSWSSCAMGRVKTIIHPNGTDIGQDITDPAENGVRIDDILGQGKKSFEVTTAADLLKITPKPVDWIVEDLVAKGVKTVIGGMTGANKSYFVMEMAVRIACGIGEFMGHAIKKDYSVLYVNLEISNDEVNRRIQKIISNLHVSHEGLQNLHINVFDNETFDDVWEKIGNTVEKVQPQLLIVDNLYASTNVNLSRNDEIKKLLRRIDNVVTENDISLILVAHFNKSMGETELSLERMQGASSLQNWIEFGILLGRSSVNTEYRLMRIVKSRISNASHHHFLLQWSNDTHLFTKKGIVENPSVHFLPVNKLGQYKEVLDEMDDRFDTMRFLNVVENQFNLTRRTGDRWIADLLTAGLIKKEKQGLFKKTELEIIKDES